MGGGGVGTFGEAASAVVATGESAGAADAVAPDVAFSSPSFVGVTDIMASFSSAILHPHLLQKRASTSTSLLHWGQCFLTFTFSVRYPGTLALTSIHHVASLLERQLMPIVIVPHGVRTDNVTVLSSMKRMNIKMY